MLFMMKLFAPLLFLPLLTVRKGWLLLGYGLAFTLLATRKEVFSIGFQYPVIVYPIALAFLPIGLAEIRTWRTRLEPARLEQALVFGCLVATLGISARFGVLVQNHAFQPGNQRFHWALSNSQLARYQWVQSAIAEIPADASVSAAFRLGAQISNREKAMAFEDSSDAEYLLLDQVGMNEKSKRRYQQMTESRKFQVVMKKEGLELWKRVGD
jgi:hypothetical protein